METAARAILLVAAGLASAIARTAGAAEGEETGSRPRVVVVDGEAVVRQAPDRAFVVLSVESRNKDPREAQRQAAATMTAVQAKLVEGGLPKDALRTISFELAQEADYVNGRRVPRDFLARNSIEVRLDDPAKTGEAIDRAIGAGATDVASVRFDLKDRAGTEREALRLAVADAKARAEAAAAGAGLSVESVQRIEEGVTGGEPRPIMMRDMVAGASAAPAPPETPIQAGEIEVRSRVRLTANLR
ncbi:SIMPL domain-containing protein [bacterium]|nr:SIMPL domain-containing protein [bacterium]